MPRISDDTFRVFISHKHEDHELAMTVQTQLEKLIPKNLADRPIECFVSGDDILAATDWNRKIRSEMTRSHLLLLLFTNSSRNWDWCLYETGLFVRFEREDVQAIVCMYEDGGVPPGPLGSVQCVAVTRGRVAKFLKDLCYETHQMSDDWRRGALAKRSLPAERFVRAADCIVESFERTLAGVRGTYHPCHRIVLDTGTAKPGKGIPVDGRLVVGEDDTSTYTMSLCGFAGIREKRTWGDVLDHLGARRSTWRRELDDAYRRALTGDLFTPVKATFVAWDEVAGQERVYKPILYEIQRRTLDRKPVGITVIFDRVDTR